MPRHAFLRRTYRNESGVSLAEVLIAIVLIGIGILASVQTFSGIQKSIQTSKGRTIAANIAQEKMQIIMQKSYYEVLVTTAPQYLVLASTTIAYDGGYFVPETMVEGGMTFTRYTDVQVIQEVNGVVQVLSPDTEDTGMRQITESVVWSADGGMKSLSIQSVLNNPNTVMSNAVLTGVVKDATTSSVIPNVLVDAAENIGWRDVTDGTGQYSINLSPGVFDFLATAPGYFPSVITLSINANTGTTQNFSLVPMSSGTVKGDAWIDNHIVISQVVASTGPFNGIEYIELYNGTTNPINMGSNTSPSTPNVWSVVFDAANPTNIWPEQLVYVSTYIPANGFYLISNTVNGAGTLCTPVTISGTNVNPDACWLSVQTPSHALQCNPIVAAGCAANTNAGGFEVGTNGGAAWSGLASTTKYDAMVWTGNGLVPPYSETAPAATAFPAGMAAGETFVRRLDTTTAWNTSFGNSYDTDNNGVDFIDYASPPFVPRTSITIKPPLTGTPAYGAIASVNDGLSQSSSATLTGAGTAFSPYYAQFTVPGVATGTWITFIDSGSASAEIDSVTVANVTTTWVPNAVTVPAWQESAAYSTIISTNGITGMISGFVKDSGGLPIVGNLFVAAGNASAKIGSNGYYFLRLSTGVYDVIANNANANAKYASMTQTLTVGLGDPTSNTNFNLPQGGKINGWITRDGTNPLPGVTVIAQDADGITQDTEVTGANGDFTLINLSTGTYTVSPVLDLKETSGPVFSTTTVTAGNTAWSSTFTVVGAMGQVTGTVKSGGQLIQSGVLIVISTTAISFPPPALSSNTLTASAYYADSSEESGTYSVDVRGSTTTTYNVAGFYMHLNGQVPVISSQTVTNVTVNAGQATSGVNFAW